MATQNYTPGPSYVQVGTAGAGALEHLGFTRDKVRITFDGAFEDVMTDVSGSRIPFDVLYEAEQAFITADFVLYDETILDKISGRIPFTLNGVTGGSLAEGTILTNGVGTLLRQEGEMFRLLVFCTYSTKPFNANMRAAYNFPTAYLDAAREIELGSGIKAQRCIFRAIPGWSQTTGGGLLYNFDITGKATPT